MQFIKIKQKVCNIKVYFSCSLYQKIFSWILENTECTFENSLYRRNRLKIILLENIFAMQKNKKSQDANLKKLSTFAI